jgi:hypothetical protein
MNSKKSKVDLRNVIFKLSRFKDTTLYYLKCEIPELKRVQLNLKFALFSYR